MIQRYDKIRFSLNCYVANQTEISQFPKSLEKFNKISRLIRAPINQGNKQPSKQAAS